mmetsp:Transcript_12487/g.18327  ORF Transcript_12487/g.18327 Transcript_12487/m.18327 type:complete len:831 (-) Transcript_12487:2564-5056(-)|eukprot:CAMPEP_0194219970 /NCGR_PEP_ID=MMETSP0156-20130528/27225_1 /TAXON_ID=33649 /ORGANISM="Thalassionema nitzschioides, Strain L26-B" /LENGTH=830 /DNA_ID=CAMNT_0038949821 /DNA_START=140 /DNA_END=2632 /DNA_ORIENTATION=+
MRQVVPKQEVYQSPGEFLTKKTSSGSATTELTASSSTENVSAPISPTDSSHTTAQNLEATISELQKALEETNQREITAQSALAKSHAVVLELRSNIRQLKRQVEEVQKEKESSDDALRSEKENTKNQMKSQMQVMESHSKDQIVGELQVQLDRAHAQILTADMVRKELEDTLEAEQYTWELRVQDQERQIVLLQQECLQLKGDLEDCRSQWQEAENGWSAEIASLKNQVNNRNDTVPEKLRILEKEREELQGCLDEAMKELEAVDQELRQNPNVLEPLQHLYRCIMQHNSVDTKEIPSDVNTLVEHIQHIVESSPNNNNQAEIAELETQISIYREDLKAREESSAELRASLREAVTLLKPLQDAVTKTEGEKRELEAKCESLRKERDMLKAETNSAENSQQELSPRTMPSGEEQTERSTREKRDFARKKFERMLSSASSRFEDLQKGSSSLTDENEYLQSQIQKLEKQLEEAQSVGGGEKTNRDAVFQMREAAIEQLEQDLEGYAKRLEEKEEEFRKLEEQLHQARSIPNDGTNDRAKLERELEQKRDVEKELTAVKQELSNKSEAERMLNDSLKEALSLLQPLQVHLETAEKEKKALARELKRTRKTMAKLDRSVDSRSTSRSVDASASQNDFDFMIDQLHEENPTKLQEDLVEMKSRSQVTEGKLNAATLRNKELKDALTEKEHFEQDMIEELAILRKKLEKSEHELENAKYIATSALMKVEELTMANISNDLLMGNTGKGKVLERPEVVEQLNQRVQSLKMEVDSAHELNESLEQSIQERDRMLNALAEQHGESPSGSSVSRYSQSNDQRQKGVTWGQNEDFAGFRD